MLVNIWIFFLMIKSSPQAMFHGESSLKMNIEPCLKKKNTLCAFETWEYLSDANFHWKPLKLWFYSQSSECSQLFGIPS